MNSCAPAKWVLTWQTKLHEWELDQPCGEPDAFKAHVRFGERGVETCLGRRIRRHTPTPHVPFSKAAAEMLFSVISNSYENQSIITTSNLEFGRWSEIFGDERLTAALIDRLVHHAHILTFAGPSYRLRQALARTDHDEAILEDVSLTKT